jgi:glucose-specific phosphotransferase system IIA component
VFSLLNGDGEGVIVAPQTGRVASLREIPDEVFSEKILGDGVAIIPSEDDVVSPVNGEVVQVADTGHAFCIRSDDGVDILIHVGVDTIGLRGKGFTSFVSGGQKVNAGDLIGKADIKFIEQNGFPTYTAVLITNMYDIKEIEVSEGPAEAGKTKVIFYSKK